MEGNVNILLVFLLDLVTNNSQRVYCDTNNICSCQAYRECMNKQIICNNDIGACNIYCGDGSTSESCSGATIHCANNQDCNIYCNGFRSCRSMIVYGNSATHLSISSTINSAEQLPESTIHCPNNAPCDIQCNGVYNQCYNLNINAENSQSLDLTCKDTAHHTCYQIDLYCPNNGNCNIKGDTTTASISNMNIYTQNGFSDISITGTSTSSIGSIHCKTGYATSCNIAVDNSQCNMNSIDKSCNIIPSLSSTFSPSKIPTTNPTENPTKSPSQIPTISPSKIPSLFPTVNPSFVPSQIPTIMPTIMPTISPTDLLSSTTSSVAQTSKLSNMPTAKPSITTIYETTIDTLSEGHVYYTQTTNGIVYTEERQYSTSKNDVHMDILLILSVCIGFVIICCAGIGCYAFKKRIVYAQNTKNKMSPQIELNIRSMSPIRITPRISSVAMIAAMQPLDIATNNASLPSNIIMEKLEHNSGEYEVFGDDETPIGPHQTISGFGEGNFTVE